MITVGWLLGAAGISSLRANSRISMAKISVDDKARSGRSLAIAEGQHSAARRRIRRALRRVILIMISLGRMMMDFEVARLG